jgi:HAD superfamily hydrolase (TIGR01549 family)
MVSAVLFDLDDTLVDHRYANHAAIAGVRERFAGLQRVALEDLLAESARLLDELHRAVALGRVAVDDARVERYRRLFAFAGANGSADPEAAARLHRALYRRSRRRVPGALELLEVLSAVARIAVVTNNTQAEQREKLATFGFAPYVESLVTSEEVGASKPDPRIFQTALARVDCDPDSAVMIGDSLVHDVEGALAAGIEPFWFDRDGAAVAVGGPFRVLTSLEPATEVARRVLARES